MGQRHWLALIAVGACVGDLANVGGHGFPRSETAPSPGKHRLDGAQLLPPIVSVLQGFAWKLITPVKSTDIMSYSISSIELIGGVVECTVNP